MIKYFKYIFIAISVLLSVLPAKAQNLKQISLQSALDFAINHSPFTKKARLDLEKAGLAQQQVDAMKILPDVSLTLRTGIVPEARGSIFYSPDKQTDLNGWGPFYQTEIKFVQPIYTFGRIDNASDAAQKLTNVQEDKNKIVLDNLKLNIVQAYWALYSTGKAVNLAKDLKNAFDSLLVKIDTEINKEDSELDQSYLFEAKSNSYIIETLYKNSVSNQILAQKTFSELVGFSPDSSVEFLDVKAPEFSVDSLFINQAIESAENSQGEILAVEAGLKAIESKIKYEKSQKSPLLYVAGGFAYSYAPNRTDQKNPFVYDNFNYLNLGAFLGLNWNLNFKQSNIEMDKWELEKLSMNENLSLLKSKLKIDINKAYYDAKNNFEILNEVRNSLQSAQSWVDMSYDNWDQGIGEPERLIKAMNAYFQIKAKELEKEFDYNISLAKLAFSTGNFNLYLDWLKNEKITIN